MTGFRKNERVVYRLPDSVGWGKFRRKQEWNYNYIQPSQECTIKTVFLSLRDLLLTSLYS